MGPLSELRKMLHKYKKNGSGTFDLNDMLDPALKSVLLIGQIQVAAIFMSYPLSMGICVKLRIYPSKMRPLTSWSCCSSDQHSIKP